MEAREERKRLRKKRKSRGYTNSTKPEHKDAEEVSENLSDKVDYYKLKKTKESF